MGQELPIRNNSQSQQPTNTYPPTQRTGTDIRDFFGDTTSRANRRQYPPIYTRQRRPDDPDTPLRIPLRDN